MMNFFQLWIAGFTNPAKFVDEIKTKPAPRWGFYAQLLRGLMDSLLLYLPLFLMGKAPPTPSNISFIPTGQYYGALIFLAPIVFFVQWLLGAAWFHVALRWRKYPSDIDLILNLTGMATLISGTLLLLWDWFWLLCGGIDQNTLGITHLIIDGWWIMIVLIGLKKFFNTSLGFGVMIILVAFALVLPSAIMFMRSPI
jgi:hypothetical protein